MARTPSRPGYLIAGGLVFLALPFLFATMDGQPVRPGWMWAGVVIALLFFFLAFDSMRRRRATEGRIRTE